jgi:dTDP-4-dehydrorhamnose reductase
MIVVAGANGMLGRDLLALFGDSARGLGHDALDITNRDSVTAVLTALQPSIVINAAAYTDVDGCESDRQRAFAVNGDAVGNLAEVTAALGAPLVQVSTDYVFDGSKGLPWVEDDPVQPLSVYGSSKLLGEEQARCNADHLIVRTQWLYGLHGKNFVETMLRLAGEREEVSVVHDQVGSPTWTADLARAIAALIHRKCRGTYHVANSGSCSWCTFAQAIFQETGFGTTVKPITTAQLGRSAPRPGYSVLDCGKLTRDSGFQPRPWRAALQDYLQARRP